MPLFAEIECNGFSVSGLIVGRLPAAAVHGYKVVKKDVYGQKLGGLEKGMMR